MDNLMKLVTTALERSYAEAQKDVSPKHLEAAAELLTLRRDAIHVIDLQSRKDEGIFVRTFSLFTTTPVELSVTHNAGQSFKISVLQVASR